MIKFYSIAENSDSKEMHQLNDLGDTFISAIIGSRSRGEWGERKSSNQTFFRKPTEEDYDRQFLNKIMDYRPPYELDNFLNYHLDYFSKNNHHNKSTYVNHIQYVILPLLKKSSNSDVQVELVNKWLNKIMGKTEKANLNVSFGDINSPSQFQINTNSSVQKQSILYSNEDVREFLKMIKNDLINLNSEEQKELEYEITKTEKNLNNGKDVKNRLSIIGESIKEIGIGTFTNLISSPVYEIIKPYLGI